MKIGQNHAKFSTVSTTNDPATTTPKVRRGLGKLIGPSREPTARRTFGVVVTGVFLVLTVLNFAWFWPIFTDQLLTRSEWLDRVWFQRWI